VFAAEIAHRVGDPEAAKVLTAELTPFAGVSAVIGNASAYLGSVEQALGWTAAARGEARAAVEHFQRALRVHEALRSPPWCARSERAIAEMRRLRLVRDSG
jgi:Flp pilus assembly protein TadD